MGMVLHRSSAKKITLSFRFCFTGVDRNQVKVRHLTSGQFSPSAVDGSFSVKISWVEPSFNYSTLVSYKIDYLTQSNNDTAVELPVSCTTSILSIVNPNYIFSAS